MITYWFQWYSLRCSTALPDQEPDWTGSPGVVHLQVHCTAQCVCVLCCCCVTLSLCVVALMPLQSQLCVAHPSPLVSPHHWRVWWLQLLCSLSTSDQWRPVAREFSLAHSLGERRPHAVVSSDAWSDRLQTQESSEDGLIMYRHYATMIREASLCKNNRVLGKYSVKFFIFLSWLWPPLSQKGKNKRGLLIFCESDSWGK